MITSGPRKSINANRAQGGHQSSMRFGKPMSPNSHMLQIEAQFVFLNWMVPSTIRANYQASRPKTDLSLAASLIADPSLVLITTDSVTEW